MQVTEKNAEGLKRSYKVVISAADIADKVEGRLEELSGKVNVPGFRPGKVPLKILKQRFGDSVRGEVLERAVNDASQQAITERGLRPAAQPKIEIVSAEDGGDLEYDLELEVLPDFEPMDFSTMELERLKVPVTDDEVDTALSRLAESQKRTEPLAEARKSEEGDVVVLDFAGTVDGEALPGMAGEGHHLELGSNSFIPGFEPQLVGVEAGESRQVTVTFPEDYGNDKLAGKEAVFDCTVKEILQAVPAEVDDKLAEGVGLKDLAELKEKVREQIDEEHNRMTRDRMKRQMLDILAEKHDFQIPEAMAEIEFDTIWRQVEQDRERGVVDPDDEGKDEEALKSEYRGIAERRVRLGLLLSEVGRRNELDVSQDELNNALVQEARRYPGQEQQVFKYYQENPQAMAQLRGPLFEEKVIDFIAELAKVSEREVSLDDLKTELEAESEPAGEGGDEAAAEKA
ncbi:MAG TPA: trigger factor [Kiloniellaceae bacterium]|nr:trigger factor [Kiloniellaceae bacterium]